MVPYTIGVLLIGFLFGNYWERRNVKYYTKVFTVKYEREVVFTMNIGSALFSEDESVILLYIQFSSKSVKNTVLYEDFVKRFVESKSLISMKVRFPKSDDNWRYLIN